MELQTSDSKKLFKVFDASKRKRTKKKREGHEDTNSVVTDDSNSACQPTVIHIMSGKASLQDLPTANPDGDSTNRERGSSHSVLHEEQRSSRRHKRQRDGMSLALKAGVVSPSRSISPAQETYTRAEAPTLDHDSFIYTFLEDAIKRDKKKRHGRRHEERSSRDCERDRDHEVTELREHRHRHRHRRDEVPSRDRDKNRKEEFSPAIDQTVLLETFAKMCAKMNENTNNSPVQRTQSHKSLQCEVASRRDLSNYNRRPERHALHELPTHPQSPSHVRPRESDTLTGIRSQENCRQSRSPGKVGSRHVNCSCYFDKDPKHESKIYYDKEKIDYGKEQKYSSKIDVNRSRVIVDSRTHEDERYRGYPARPAETGTCVYREGPRDNRDYRGYDRRNYDEERRRYLEQSTSRSFDVHRNGYEEERCRRTSRSDTKAKRYDYKYYEKTNYAPERHFPSKERRARRPTDQFDRNSIASKEEEYRDRDRYSERERDSGLSVADGDTSTISGRTGRSNCLRVVKQEIAEQREAMDKMMKLWKDLMRCFKGISQTQDKDKTVNETAACESARESAAAQLRLWRECMRRYETVARDVGDTDARLMETACESARESAAAQLRLWRECMRRYETVARDVGDTDARLMVCCAGDESARESAAAQLRLWRECMRRYETVARDVGDTDARLMDEINKQRSEMSEMATMWQECLQRYRDISNDFNTLKQQLATSESPTRQPAAPALVCAEGEGTTPAPNYRVPPSYPQLGPLPGGCGYGCGRSPLRGRASAPPWWWAGEQPAPAPRRRSSRHSSPDSRDGRNTDRDRRHRHKEPRDEPRYKDKSSKPSAARSEHRRRKR